MPRMSLFDYIMLAWSALSTL